MFSLCNVYVNSIMFQGFTLFWDNPTKTLKSFEPSLLNTSATSTFRFTSASCSSHPHAQCWTVFARSIEVIRFRMITVAGLDTLARPGCHNVYTCIFYIITLINMTNMDICPSNDIDS